MVGEMETKEKPKPTPDYLMQLMNDKKLMSSLPNFCGIFNHLERLLDEGEAPDPGRARRPGMAGRREGQAGGRAHKGNEGGSRRPGARPGPRADPGARGAAELRPPPDGAADRRPAIPADPAPATRVPELRRASPAEPPAEWARFGGVEWPAVQEWTEK